VRGGGRDRRRNRCVIQALEQFGSAFQSAFVDARDVNSASLNFRGRTSLLSRRLADKKRRAPRRFHGKAGLTSRALTSVPHSALELLWKCLCEHLL